MTERGMENPPGTAGTGSADGTDSAKGAGDELTVAARRTWAGLDVLHVVGYFSRENRELNKALHVRPSHAYFAVRSAALGPVSAQVCAAVFYVFSPALVGSALPAAWDAASPTEFIAAWRTGVRATLTRILGDALQPADQQRNLTEAADLARTACDGLTLGGRPLYAGLATLPWPEEPLMALWHAASLLREHRGDGHMSALLHAPLDPVEAVITGGLQTGNTAFMRASRGWTEDEWAGGEQRLRARGLIDGVDEQTHLTEAGLALRTRVEQQTDAAARGGWDHLGLEGTTRLGRLVQPWVTLVLESGVIPANVHAPRR